MTQPKTSEELLTEKIGGPWPADPAIRTWIVNGPNGPEEMSFQWRETGAKVSLGVGDIALSDERTVVF